MIDKKTVFILGAGASCPYGYPTGAGLRQEICESFKGQYLRHVKATESNSSVRRHKLQEVRNFVDKFEKSSTKSIDLFLARNKSLAEIGKYVIAFKVLEAEQKSRFRERSFNPQQDWYFYLFNRMTDELEKKERLSQFHRNNVSFITFNYDRSLEHFLFESLRYSFSEIPKDEIINEVKQIKIIHIYDKVDPLPWQDEQEGVEYKPKVSEGTLKTFSRNLKTIYETLSSPPIDEARQLIGDAEQIFFLGFGYAIENMVILKLPEAIPPSCRVLGTALDLEERETEDILGRIVGGLKKNHKGSRKPERVKIENMDCLKLLRKYL